MISKLRGKKRHRYRSVFFMTKEVRGGGHIRKKVSSTISVPIYLSIYEDSNRKRLYDVIRAIHHNIKHQETTIELDFSRTISIYADAMLWLYAEIKNILNIHTNVQFTCKKPSNEKVSHVLHQVGIYSICKERFIPNRKYNDVIHWRTCSGTHVIAEQYDHITDNRSDLFNPDLDLFGGCAEATKNALKHAYLEQRNLSHVESNKEAWWIFSQIKDGAMCVCICDLGIGIPRTLPITKKEWLRSVIKKLGDDTSSADLILAALDKNKSRTKKDYHGNGLPKIASIVRKTGQGQLVINSNDGYVLVGKSEPRLKSYKTPIPGTIVSWTLPVSSKYE